MTSGHAQRGKLWLERGRADKAEEELRQALALDPDDGELMADLARCLLQLERNDEALVLARDAVGAEPEWAYPRLILAAALLESGKPKPGEQVAREAIELDPELPAAHSMLAGALGMQKRWKESLAAAEGALALDPEDEVALNARSHALTQLGRREQAAEGLEASLRRDPENPRTHMHLGWNALHGGEHEEAIVHFREALRLDPQEEGARAGLVEAMKSRTGLYRPFLAWFLLLSRIPTRTAYMLFFGTVILRGFLSQTAKANPSLAVVIWPLYWGIVAFILMSWIAAPLFDLTLRLSKDGKYALSEEEIFNSTCLGGVLLLALVLLVAGLAGAPAMLLAAGLTGALSIPVVRALHAENGKKRALHGLTLAILFLLAFGATVQRFRFERWRDGLSAPVRELAELEVGDERRTRLESLGPAQQDVVRVQWPAYAAEVEARVEQRDQANSMTTMFLWGFVLQTWLP